MSSAEEFAVEGFGWLLRSFALAVVIGVVAATINFTIDTWRNK